MDADTKQVLVSILQMMKQQAIYLDRQHRWIVAVADSVDSQPELSAYLRKHPFFDLGPRRDLDRTNDVIQNIDALTQLLKD